MPTALATTAAAPLAVAAELVERARTFAAEAKATRTRDAYRREWGTFAAWCEARGLEALPAAPSTLALFLTDRASAGIRPASLDVALAAVSEAHRAAGLDSPRGSAEVRAVRSGIRRTLGTAQRQAAPVLVADLRAMAGALPDSLAGHRDRALLLVGFAGGFRRSELVALEVADAVFGADGVTVTIRRSKTDQEGQGRKVGIPYGSTPATCPVRALRRWLDVAAIHEGPLFRSVHTSGAIGERLGAGEVARIVKRTATAAGLDAALFSGHSLRAGLATSAAKAGKSERAIMAQTGHRSSAMVRRYIRDASLFADNAAAGLGL